MYSVVSEVYDKDQLYTVMILNAVATNATIIVPNMKTLLDIDVLIDILYNEKLRTIPRLLTYVDMQHISDTLHTKNVIVLADMQLLKKGIDWLNIDDTHEIEVYYDTEKLNMAVYNDIEEYSTQLSLSDKEQVTYDLMILTERIKILESELADIVQGIKTIKEVEK